MTTRPPTERGRATRERILRAGGELVGERGVAGVSLDDVRDRAGASKSQLYHYFADRDALMRDIARGIADDVLASQADLIADFDSLAGIRAYLDAIVAFQEQQDCRGGCPIGSLAGQIAERDPQAREVLADGFDRWEAGLRDGLRAMAQRGELADGADPQKLATQCLALLQGGLVLTQVRRDPAQIRAAADGVIDLVEAARPAR